MQRGFVFATLLLALASPVRAEDDDARARSAAQEALDRGAALFDARDAAGIAATYVDDAQILLIKRDKGTNKVQLESARGRDEIRKGYEKIFKDREPEHRSRNTVDLARFLGPNLLLIHGRFALNAPQGDVIQFVQIRARDAEGAPWKIVSLSLAPLPAQDP